MKHQLKAMGLVFFSMCLSIFSGIYPPHGTSHILFGEPDFPEKPEE